MALICLFSCKKGENAANETKSITNEGSSSETNASKTQTTQPVTNEYDAVEVYSIEAFGLKLKYPAKWKGQVTAKQSDNRLCFTFGKQKLFDLVFNGDDGYVLGTVRGDEYTVIKIVDYEIEIDSLDAFIMQEDINCILNYLQKDYDFVAGHELIKEDTSTFDIKTSVTTLKYPAKWKDKVTIKVTDKKVEFSSGKQKIFDLVFEECDGCLLGTYKGTPIYVSEYDLQTDEQNAMLEDVNVIYSYLQKDKNFVIN